MSVERREVCWGDMGVRVRRERHGGVCMCVCVCRNRDGSGCGESGIFLEEEMCI